MRSCAINNQREPLLDGMDGIAGGRLHDESDERLSVPGEQVVERPLPAHLAPEGIGGHPVAGIAFSCTMMADDGVPSSTAITPTVPSRPMAATSTMSPSLSTVTSEQKPPQTFTITPWQRGQEVIPNFLRSN
jgi:hypothetical protein